MVFVAAPVVIAVIVMCLVGKGKGDSNAMIGYPSYQLGDTAVLMLLSYGLVNVFLTIGFITPYRRFTMAVLHGHWSEAGKAWRLEETVSVGTGNNNGGQVQQQTVTRNQLRGRSDGRLVMMERRQQGRGSGVAPARGITAGSSSRISCKK
jgi:hypothetical protein